MRTPKVFFLRWVVWIGGGVLLNGVTAAAITLTDDRIAFLRAILPDRKLAVVR
jgi:hypothetical protein